MSQTASSGSLHVASDDYWFLTTELFRSCGRSVQPFQLEEARTKAQEWRIQREHAIYLETERIRQEEEAYNASCTELKSIMVQWTEDKRMEQFFREAEVDAASLDET